MIVRVCVYVSERWLGWVVQAMEGQGEGRVDVNMKNKGGYTGLDGGVAHGDEEMVGCW